jgi:hypothetical protein
VVVYDGEQIIEHKLKEQNMTIDVDIDLARQLVQKLASCAGRAHEASEGAIRALASCPAAEEHDYIKRAVRHLGSHGAYEHAAACLDEELQKAGGQQVEELCLDMAHRATYERNGYEMALNNTLSCSALRERNNIKVAVKHLGAYQAYMDAVAQLHQLLELCEGK